MGSKGALMATEVMTKAGIFGRLDTVIVRVCDLVRAKSWYQDVLELTPRFETEQIVVFDTGGPTSLTLEYPGPEVDAQVVRLGAARCYPIFYSDNIDAIHNLLSSRGVKVDPILDDGAVRYFAFEDLEGNFFNVCQF
jgi:catechol 2,3-dioxygenase-like lactoylglutathione lyase family enzyme